MQVSTKRSYLAFASIAVVLLLGLYLSLLNISTSDAKIDNNIILTYSDGSPAIVIAVEDDQPRITFKTKQGLEPIILSLNDDEAYIQTSGSNARLVLSTNLHSSITNVEIIKYDDFDKEIKHLTLGDITDVALGVSLVDETNAVDLLLDRNAEGDIARINLFGSQSNLQLAANAQGSSLQLTRTDAAGMNTVGLLSYPGKTGLTVLGAKDEANVNNLWLGFDHELLFTINGRSQLSSGSQSE